MPKPVLVGDLGVHEDNTHNTAKNYLFDKIFYDSSIEKRNIVDEIEYVIVFTKIPKTQSKSLSQVVGHIPQTLLI